MDGSRSNLVKIGKYISTLRKQNGYTQKKLGEILDISDKTVSKWEQGAIAPDITILSSLANVLGVSVEEILLGESITKSEFRNESGDISTYSNQARKKLVRDSILLFFFFLIIILFLVSLNKNKLWDIKSFNIKSDVLLDGKYFENDEKSLFLINKISFAENIDLDNTDNIKIIVYKNDDVLFSNVIEKHDFKSFEDRLSNYNIFFECNNKLSNYNVMIRIIVHNKNDQIVAYTYKIN